MKDGMMKGMLTAMASMFEKDEQVEQSQKITPRFLRKAFPSLYKEFIYSDYEDVTQFLIDGNQVDMVLEAMDDEETRAMEGDND